MGTVISFNRSRQPKPRRPELAIDAPKARALKRLAETLEKTRLAAFDRVQVASNWHAILKDLKHGHGLSSKEKVYEVLRNPGSTDSAQKKSWNYEISPTLSEVARTERTKKLTQRGDRWLKIAERAADLVGMGRYDLLPDLLKGTSIAPPTVTPNADTPDPIASLLELANAACAKIATEVDLKRYFADWNQGWVQHRFKDGRFLTAPVDEADDNDWVAPIARFDNELSEELSDRPFINGLPLPYVSFGKYSRFSFRARLVPHSEFRDEQTAGRIVEVNYMREFGLAIAVNAYDGTIAPALEVRHFPVMRDAKTHENIPFWPVGGFPDAPGFFESYHDCKDWAEADEGEIYAGPLSGELELPERTLWVWLSPQLTADDVERGETALSRSDRRYPKQNSELEIHYSLLTPQTAQTIVDTWCEPTRALGDRHTLADSMGDGLRILESMLLEGDTDGGMFDLLLRDARRKVEDFQRAYGRVLLQVQEDHRKAMSEFS